VKALGFVGIVAAVVEYFQVNDNKKVGLQII